MGLDNKSWTFIKGIAFGVGTTLLFEWWKMVDLFIALIGVGATCILLACGEKIYD